MNLPRIYLLLAILMLLSSLSACGLLLPPTRDRLDIIRQPSACSARADTLLLLLPGRYDTPQDLISQGFPDALRRAGVNADIALPDLHFGYVLAGSAVERLHADIILPARRAGYRHVWLAGISIGGTNALLYLQQHPGLADGAFLIAPYLGEDGLLREIADAGGAARWTSAAAAPEDFGRALWLWLQARGAESDQPRLYLGYGASDRFVAANALLAATLPPQNTVVTDGGHQWEPWLRIWKAFLDKGALPVCANP
jgi:pimeloyl-ACP methyl ester carboxylesterase